MEDGYIKFNPIWNKTQTLISKSQLQELNSIRTRLLARKWLGELPSGVGFGNISVRDTITNRFLITGSGTGGIQELKQQHFSLVTDVDIASNTLVCEGECLASSESMSHAVFYDFNSKIRSIIHIHCNRLWNKYFGQFPTSDPKASYGTPEMAFSVQTLLNKMNIYSGIIVMGGHEDGIIVFGSDLFTTYKLLEKL